MASPNSKKCNRRETKRIFQSFSRNGAGGDPRGTVIVGSNRQKMSEVLLDFIDPYRHDDESEEDLRSLITISITAWNMSSLPKVEREMMIYSLIARGPAVGANNLRSLVNNLIARKEKYFSSCRRYILGFELTMKPEDLHLNVVSTLI